MLVTLYTSPECAQCALTKAALADCGIAFTERSAADYAQALAAKGYDTAPVLAVSMENELIAWHGHRPDMIELLADLFDLGPVSARGLRDRESADEAVVTRIQVMEEIGRHQLNAQEFFADCGNHPLYRGHVLLEWLGY
jgi:glutaredoxin